MPRGPVAMGSVKIVGRNDGWMQKPTTFEIQVTEHGSSFAVQRRYKEFLKLEAALRAQFPDLPSMPPRSFVIRRLDPSFLDARERNLSELLEAALLADPTISVPAFRTFLGLEKSMDNACTVHCVEDSMTVCGEVSGQCANPSVKPAFDCALCHQCFQEQRGLECHMRFTHEWDFCD